MPARYASYSNDICLVLSPDNYQLRLSSENSQTNKSSLKLFQSQEKLTKMVLRIIHNHNSGYYFRGGPQTHPILVTLSHKWSL